VGFLRFEALEQRPATLGAGHGYARFRGIVSDAAAVQEPLEI